MNRSKAPVLGSATGMFCTAVALMGGCVLVAQAPVAESQRDPVCEQIHSGANPNAVDLKGTPCDLPYACKLYMMQQCSPNSPSWKWKIEWAPEGSYATPLKLPRIAPPAPPANRAPDGPNDHQFCLPISAAAELLVGQASAGSGQTSDGKKEIIVTLFGYFEYESILDLIGGGKILKLKFYPFLFGKGGTEGQRLDSYISNAQLFIQPDDPQIPETSIQARPNFKQSDAKQLIAPPKLEWSWTVRQSWLSSVTDTDGNITIVVTSSGQDQRVTLPFKIKGRPTWWLLIWLWEQRAEVWPLV